MKIEEFFEANQVDGKLTDAQAMQMLSLQEGDTVKTESDVPAVAAEVKPEPEAKVEATPAAETQPVILAKDGVHTIPFEKLTEAREAEKHWKTVAEQAQQQIEALKSAPVQAAPGEPARAADSVDFGDYSDDAIKEGIKKTVALETAAIKAEFEAKLAAVVEPIQQQQQISAADEHFSTIYKAHPDVESVVESKQMNDWIESQPSFARSAIRNVIAQGSAADVVELLDTFKSSTAKLATTAVPTVAAAAAQAAIAKAQSAPPTSLSEIPAGSAAHTDQASAMLDMSSTGILSMFEGKTPEQINALMNRVL